MVDVKLEVDQYGGVFKKKTKNGVWRKFWQMGNAGVSIDIAELLTKLGHKVEIENIETEE